MSFFESLFLKLNNKQITSEQNKLLEFIAAELFTFEDDEIEPPSSMIALQATACGQKLPQVLASSINTFGVHHACFSEALQFIINGYKTDKKYYPGFGHPRYKDFDPRTKRVLEKALIINYSNNNIQKSCEYSHAVGLPLNIGGLTACVLLDCGCNIYNADLFPIICRSVGLTLIHQNAKQEKIKFSSSYDIIRKYNNTDNI